MIKFFFPALLLLLHLSATAQFRWTNVTAGFGDLPGSVQVYKTVDSLDGKPNIAWFVEADVKDLQLVFTTDTTLQRRLTPQQFYERNENPLVVVNTTFFSFATDQNLNVVMRNGSLLGYNIHTMAGRGKDTLTYQHPLGSAIGISKKRGLDIAWLYTDSSLRYPLAIQSPMMAVKDSSPIYKPARKKMPGARKWKMQTAVGGGPVLVQRGHIHITNEEERRFYGKAIDDRHPRTAMGYTKENKLLIVVIEGRNPGIAEGASLTQLANIFTELGAVEALNLDGGGSSCMLVNGQQTIQPSDKKQRPVPGVFVIKRKQ